MGLRYSIMAVVSSSTSSIKLVHLLQFTCAINWQSLLLHNYPIKVLSQAPPLPAVNQNGDQKKALAHYCLTIVIAMEPYA